MTNVVDCLCVLIGHLGIFLGEMSVRIPDHFNVRFFAFILLGSKSRLCLLDASLPFFSQGLFYLRENERECESMSRGRAVGSQLSTVQGARCVLGFMPGPWNHGPDLKVVA